MINVCFICDENYALATRTAINSLVQNQKQKLKIYVVGIDLTAENLNKFNKFAGDDVEICLISSDNLYQNVGANHLYVSKAGLFKFVLPELIAEDKVLYLDDDMIITDDLSQLYDVDIENKYAAVVKDMAGMEQNHHIKMEHKNYFNAGMMLLNLHQMRKDSITSKLFTAKKNDVWKDFMDQDALNLVFAENVVYVSPRYNYMLGNILHFSKEQIAGFYGVKKEELEHIAIYHLTNKTKPWQTPDCFLFDLWLKYALSEDLKTLLPRYFAFLAQRMSACELQIKDLQCKLDVSKPQIKICKEKQSIWYRREKKDGVVTRYFCGLPLYRRKGKKMYFCGVQFWHRKKEAAANEEKLSITKPKICHDLLEDYKPQFARCGYMVERCNGKIRISGGNLLIEGNADNTLWTAASVFCTEEYHFDINEPYVMFDIGLNLAMTALYKARDKNCVKIYGYEPFTPTFQLAQKNLELNPQAAAKITAFNFGLGDADKTLEINYNPERPGAMSSVKNIFSESAMVEKIQIKRASKVLAPLLQKHKQKIFLKIDCEGAEKEILPDLAQAGLLSKADVIVMEWHYENPQQLIELLKNNGFIVFCNNTVFSELGIIRAYRER